MARPESQTKGVAAGRHALSEVRAKGVANVSVRSLEEDPKTLAAPFRILRQGVPRVPPPFARFLYRVEYNGATAR